MMDKPIVVLAGWFGCQPKHLRRYKEAYRRLGWDSVTRVAGTGSSIDSFTVGPYNRSSELKIEGLIISILQELQIIQPPHVLVHVFSNNGSIIWEWIRYFLFENTSALPSEINAHQLKKKLVGVVFDSAPVITDDSDGIINILRQSIGFITSETEKSRLLDTTETLDKNRVRDRQHDFWNGLCNDSTGIPQLYLYSQTDSLAPADQLMKLVASRERMLGKERVWKHDFLDSHHCGHLLKYPEEYCMLVAQFVSFCIRQAESFNISKL